MKRILLTVVFVAILLSGATLMGCKAVPLDEAAGPIRTETYDFTDFTGIEIGNAFKLEVTASMNYSVTITAREKTLDNITVSRDGDTLKIGVGLTAKIRDAGIRIEGGGQESEKTNVGFVPIINFLVDWRFSPAWSLLLEGDALAAPQGRAEDVFLGLVYRTGAHWSFRAGYRILEGGSDVEEVYNFALVNYLALGAAYRF